MPSAGLGHVFRPFVFSFARWSSYTTSSPSSQKTFFFYIFHNSFSLKSYTIQIFTSIAAFQLMWKPNCDSDTSSILRTKLWAAHQAFLSSPHKPPFFSVYGSAKPSNTTDSVPRFLACNYSHNTLSCLSIVFHCHENPCYASQTRSCPIFLLTMSTLSYH